MTRDLTDKQFRAALDRNGLELMGLWIVRKGGGTHGIGVLCDRKWKIRRRESLAHALRRFAKIDAKKEAQA